jgi:hypothetical protein
MRGARSRIVTATLIVAAGCASLPAPERDLERRVSAVLPRLQRFSGEACLQH